METPFGPRGRRARWHETLSQFDLEVQYIPGSENTVPDALSRWAYPASSAREDVSFHGSATAKEEVKQMLQDELAKSQPSQPTTPHTMHEGSQKGVSGMQSNIACLQGAQEGFRRGLGKRGEDPTAPPRPSWPEPKPPSAHQEEEKPKPQPNALTAEAEPQPQGLPQSPKDPAPPNPSPGLGGRYAEGRSGKVCS